MFHVEHNNPKVAAFHALLRRWNPAIRLTGSTDAAAFERHQEEASTLLPFLPENGTVVDVGSGGGFPAILLAIWRPGQTFTLVEPIAKKIAFLRTCRRELNLENVSVQRRRDDELEEPSFDIATSQATFEPTEWFRRARRLVRPGGTILALLGPNATNLPADATIHRIDVGDRDRRVGVVIA